MTDVSIIIINYNTLNMTLECIESVLLNTSEINFEIILVDNASIDGSKEYFEKDSRIKYIYNEKNLGFGRANNIGIDISSGRNILFLNSDTILMNNAVKIMSDFLDATSSVGACGGNLYTLNGAPNVSFRRQLPSVYDSLNGVLLNVPNRLLFRRNQYFNYSMDPIDVGFVCGADMMVKRNVLDKVGYFNPLFFMYYEETELSYRIKKHYKIMNIPQAKIVHLDGGSFDKNNISKEKQKRLSESKVLYFTLTHSNFYYLIVCILDKLASYTQLLYNKLK